jgi:hypothetical protein
MLTLHACFSGSSQCPLTGEETHNSQRSRDKPKASQSGITARPAPFPASLSYFTQLSWRDQRLFSPNGQVLRVARYLAQGLMAGAGRAQT